MGFTEQDRRFMRRALELAARGRGRVEPNPMVGAVLVREGRVLGEGHYERFGGPHAEVIALRKAGEAAAGAAMYVTLEPCDHAGKTPACAPALAAAGLRRVMACTLDPTAASPGGGVRMLRQAGVEVQVGLLRREAARLNAGFFKLAAAGRPLVIAKWAMSLDGRIATRTGESRWISSPEARRRAHELRSTVDCVIIGAGTALRDDPLLTCREAEARRVASRLVLCGRRAPGPGSRLAESAREAPVLLACVEGSRPEGMDRLVALGCEPLPVAASAAGARRPDPAAVLDALGKRRMTNVLVEGGGTVLGAFFDAALVDRVVAFVSPVILGGSGAVAPVAGEGAGAVADALRLSESRIELVGPDALIQGWTVEPARWAPSEDLEPEPER